MKTATRMLVPLLGLAACTPPVTVQPASPASPRTAASAEPSLDAAAESSSDVDAQPAPEGESIVMAYACDEKYAEVGRCTAGSDEYRVWLSTSPATFRPRSLGSRRTMQEGGPEGAEWNPSNDWVLFARSTRDDASVVVGTTTIRDSDPAVQGWIAFRIPERVWKAAERPLTPRDASVPPGLVSALSIVDLTFRKGPSTQAVAVWLAYGE